MPSQPVWGPWRRHIHLAETIFMSSDASHLRPWQVIIGGIFGLVLSIGLTAVLGAKMFGLY